MLVNIKITSYRLQFTAVGWREFTVRDIFLYFKYFYKFDVNVLIIKKIIMIRMYAAENNKKFKVILILQKFSFVNIMSCSTMNRGQLNR